MVILNVGKYAPRFKMGFTVMSVLSVGEFTMIFVIRWFVNRDKRKAAFKEESQGKKDEVEDELHTRVRKEEEIPYLPVY